MGRGAEETAISKEGSLLSRSVATKEAKKEDSSRSNEEKRGKIARDLSEEELERTVEERMHLFGAGSSPVSFNDKLRAALGSKEAKKKIRNNKSEREEFEKKAREEEAIKPFLDRMAFLRRQGLSDFSSESETFRALRDSRVFPDAYAFSLTPIDNDLLREDGDNFVLLVFTTSSSGEKEIHHEEFVESMRRGKAKAQEFIEQETSERIEKLKLFEQEERERKKEEEEKRRREKKAKQEWIAIERERKDLLKDLSLSGVSEYAHIDMKKKYKSERNDPDNFLFDKDEISNLERKDFSEWSLLTWRSVRSGKHASALFLNGELYARTSYISVGYGNRIQTLSLVERDKEGKIVENDDSPVIARGSSPEEAVIQYIKEKSKERAIKEARQSSDSS
jgi:hypothetical protein